MDLTLSEEQRLLVGSARGFLSDYCPISDVRSMERDALGFARGLWKQMARLGWLDHSQNSFLDIALLIEEMGRALLPSPFIACVVASAWLLRECGSERHHQWLRQIEQGDRIATLALAEPGGRDEHGSPSMEARRAGSMVRLRGAKSFVPFAGGADLILITAQLDDEGVSLIAIEPGDSGWDATRLATLSGDPLYALHCTAVEVPAERIVSVGPAASAALALAIERATVAALAYVVGVAERVLEMTLDYARTRVQFGRPIGSFQAIAHRCVDMRSDIDAVRWLTYQAAWTVHRGVADMEVSAAAKAYGNDAVRRIFMHAHQVFGAMGFSAEHDLHLFTRRAKAIELTWGGTDRHLRRVADAMGL